MSNWYKYINIECKDGNVDAWLIEINEGQFIYIPWNSLLIELTESGKKELTAYIKKKQVTSIILAIKEIIEANPSPQVETLTNKPFEPTFAALSLTDSCNLRCIYCHSDAKIKCTSELSRDVAKVAMELVAKNAKKFNNKFEVSFTGPGEPTNAWDLLTWCTSTAYELEREYDVKLDISMATNGMYEAEKREFIVEHFNGVSLSFDGIEEIQNLHRPRIDNSESFPTVFETAMYFHKHWGQGRKNFRFALRATISQVSVNKMGEIQKFFYQNFPKAKVGYEMLNPIGRGKYCNEGSITPPNKKMFTKNLMKLIENNEDDKIINSGSGRVGELKRTFCKALAMPTMNITTKGSLVACQRDGAPDYYEYGCYNPLTKGFDLDLQKIEYFRGLIVDRYPECKDCIAKYHCAGECHDLRRIGMKRCYTNIELVRAHLKKILLEKGEDHVQSNKE